MKSILPMTAFLAAALGAAAADAPAAPRAGADAYKAKCASCHAKDGTGNSAMAKMFKVKPGALNLVDKDTLDQKDEDLAKIIDTGKGKMPAFTKEKLKGVSVADLIAFMRSMAPVVKEDARPADKPADKTEDKPAVKP